MSDAIDTQTPAAAAAAPSAVATPASSGEADILARKLGEQNQRVAALNEQLAAALRERDTWKESAAKLDPVAKEATDLRVKVEGYVNAGREAAIVEHLRAALPAAEALTIRGVLSSLHEAGKINRYNEDTASEASKILEFIKTEAPSLTRTPTGAGGSSAVASTPQRPMRKSLVG